MILKKLVAIAVVAVLASSIHGQTADCFVTHKMPAVSLLSGDVHRVVIEDMVRGNNLQFAFDKGTLPLEGVKILTSSLDPISSGTSEESFEGCIRPRRGVTENDYVVLCGEVNKKNHVIFFSTNPTTRIFHHPKKLDLADKVDDCYDIQTSPTTNWLYLACNKNTKLVILRVDSLTKSISDTNVLEITQSEDSKISAPLRLAVGDEGVGSSDDAIYVWEDREVAAKVAFRRLTFKGGDLVDNGYFSKESSSIKLTKGNVISSIYHFEGRLAIVTEDRGDAKSFYVDECAFIQDGKPEFGCKNQISIETEELASTYIPKFARESEPFDQQIKLKLYLLTKKEIGFYNIDEDNWKAGEYNKFDFADTPLAEVDTVTKFGHHLYVMGTRKEEAVSSSVVIKFSTVKPYYATFAYKNPSADAYPARVALLANDPYDAQNAYVVLGNKKAVSTFKIVPAELEIDTTKMAETAEDAEPFVKGQITLTCSKGDAVKGQSLLSLSVLTKPHRAGDFKLPSMSFAYLGSKKSFYAVSEEGVTGNAPSYSLKTDDADGNIVFQLDYVSDDLPVQKPKDVTAPLSDLQHLGENYFLVTGAGNTRVVVKADYLPEKRDVLWTKPIKQIELSEGQRLVKAYVEQSVLVTIKTSIRKLDIESQKPETIVEVVSLRSENFDPQTSTSELEADFAAIKVVDGDLHITILGKESWSDLVSSIYHMKFSVINGAPTGKFKQIKKFKEHFCPEEVSWSPRGSNDLLITSICRKQDGQDSHVITFRVAFYDPIYSDVVRVDRIKDTRDFSICAQHNVVNIVDRDRDVVYSLDLVNARDSPTYFPLQEYGFKHVETLECDQTNNLLQVVACTNADKTDCSLLTYHGNSVNQPNKRVHSVVRLNKPIRLIASTYSYTDDVTLTLQADPQTGELWPRAFYLQGPHLTYDTTKTTEELDEVKFTLTANYFTHVDGKSKKEVAHSHFVTVVKQSNDVTIKLQDPSKKLVADGSKIELEQFVKIEGPYHKIGKQAKGDVSIFDRLSPSSQYNHIDKRFDDMTIYQDFVFGLIKDVNKQEVQIHVVGTKSTTIFKTASKASLHVVENGNTIYFITHLSAPLVPDKLVALVWVKGESGFWKEFDIEIPHGFVDIQIAAIGNDRFFISGYNNERNGLIHCETIQVTDNSKATSLYRHPILVGANLAEFDHVQVSKFEIILMAAKQFSDKMTFYRLVIDEEGMMTDFGTSTVDMIPKISESHENVAFECTLRPESTVRCVIAGKNIYSYVTEYTFLPPGDGFIKESSVKAILNNIVNLVPRSCDISGDFVVFLAQNRSPLKEKQLPGGGSLFSDQELAVVYNLDSTASKVSEVDNFSEFDVYKLLTQEDLATHDAINFARVHPHFVTVTDGSTKLLVNVGTADRAVRLFNLDGLSMIAPKGSLASVKEFEVFQLDGTTAKVSFESLLDDPGSEPGPKHKSAVLIVILTIAVVLVVLIILAGLTMQRREVDLKDDLALDPVEQTMRATDNEGSYTKL